MSAPDAIVIENVTKTFRLSHRHTDSLKASIAHPRRRNTSEIFTALDDVSLTVPNGSTVGIIGANGSGKSTLLKCIARILYPDSGRLTVRGRVASLLELGTGFHPDLSGRDNVFLNGSLLGLSRHEIRQRFDEIVDFSQLERFIDNPIKTYSSGMRVRLAFAVATTVDADVLLLDEVLAVGDMGFKVKSRKRMSTLLNSGCTIVLVSHDLTQLGNLCDSGVVLDAGRVRFNGAIQDALADYKELMTPVTAPGDDGGLDDHRAIRDAWLFGADGEPTDHLGPNDTSFLRIHLDAARIRASQPLLAVSLRGDTGFLLSWQPVQDALDELPETGTVEIDVAIGELGLLDGNYEWSVIVRDVDEGRLIERSDRVATFAVVSNRPKANQGVIPVHTSFTRRTLDRTATIEPPVISRRPG